METHRFDIISFIFGALFLAFVASVLWDTNFAFDIGDWVLPGALLIIGVALLASGIRAAIRKVDL
jgi:hypothetical protein